VTGGTRGIGAAISKALKAAGYKVAANYGGNDEAAQKVQGRDRHPGVQMGRLVVRSLRRRHQAGRGRFSGRSTSWSTMLASVTSNTEMVQAVPKDVLENSILPTIPIGRLGEPEEIGRCVVFLAADDAGLITGSTLTANGAQYIT
jgi:NAD(P)-dependent dehydrogenase (short-subunit alcohol dehydrogenase family)